MLVRIRWLGRDFERLPTTAARLHYVAFDCLMLARALKLFGEL